MSNAHNTNLSNNADILAKIVANKIIHIKKLKQQFPEDSLKPFVSDRSLFLAMKQKNTGFILECKKASPSKGLIRENFDIDAIANTYKDYANAISVLTDETFFQGDINFIPKVRAKVSQPILCKDFIIDKYQITLAAHQGADAILLMLSILDDKKYQQLAEKAAHYHLDILTEISNEEELSRAIALNAKIIGINNRNLRDLSTTLHTTEILAPQIPKDRIIISESGIHHHQDIRRLSHLVNGFLVGSSLMAEPDLDFACRKLIFGENKICGITQLTDIRCIANAGGTYIGLIFVSSSPRAIKLAQAKELFYAHQNDPKQVKFIGVFVNEKIETIVNYATQITLYAIQLHGNETASYIDKLKFELHKNNSNAQVWKSIPINCDNNDENLRISLPNNIDRVLYDSCDKHLFGGTGKTFDWQQPLPLKESAFLAGGLNTQNTLQAAKAGFAGLDFNSGIEDKPGIKNHQLINQVFKLLRQY